MGSAESVSHRCAPQWPSDVIFSPRILLFVQIQLPFAFLGIVGAIAVLPVLAKSPLAGEEQVGPF